MSKTQAALQRRLGRLSMFIDLTAEFIGDSRLLNQLRAEMGILKEPNQDPAALSRSVGRATVVVQEISRDLPNQKEMMAAMIKELELAGEIISRIDSPLDAPPKEKVLADGSGRR